MPADDTRRLFFALWPDTATIDAIDRATDRLLQDGRRIPLDKLHLTLAFLGRCTADDVQVCCRRADQIRLSPFDIMLDRVGYFARPRIGWLGPSRVPDGLRRLATALASPALENRVFRPHVSLARGAESMPASTISPIAWNVRHFALIESGVSGQPGAYRTLQEWPLEGPR